MWCHSSTSKKRPRWKTLSLPHRSRSLSNGLKQCWWAGCPHHAISAWDSTSHMRKWATGTSGAWLQRSWKIFFEPSGPAHSERLWKSFLLARPSAVCLLSLPHRWQNFQGYSPTYHSEHHHFVIRQYNRATRGYRGTLAPGYFNAGISNTVVSVPQLAYAHTPEIAAATPPKSLSRPTILVGTTGSLGTKPEYAPHHTVSSRGISTIKENPFARWKTTPVDDNGGQRLHHQLRSHLLYRS